MRNLLGAMAWSTVQHDEQVMLGVALREFVEEHLQASVVHPRQIQAEALSGGGLDRRVQVGPFVGALHYIGWSEPRGAVASPMPVDESETSFVEGENLQRLLAVTIPGLADGVGEVFLKASCLLWSAFSWRGRPVLSFALRRLRNWPTPSGWEYSMPCRSRRNSSA